MLLSILSWALLVCLAWLFRVSYIGWLGPYLLACAVLLPILILLLSLPSILALKISLSTPDRILRDSQVSLTLSFQNPRLFPVHSVTVTLELFNRFTGDKIRQSYIFRNVESSTSSLPFPSSFCGQVECRIARVRCRDLLGLFSLPLRRESICRCTIMPSAVEPSVLPDFEKALQTANILHPKYGGGFAEDHDLRTYQPGDSGNTIHWKLSSKMDELIVREALVPENSTIFVILQRVGEKDHGLEVLRWLCGNLLALEEPFTLVADIRYPIDSEVAADNAIASLLSCAMRDPVGFDSRNARCVFIVSGEEVQIV